MLVLNASLAALVPGEKRYGSGARSLWWLAANVATLAWYGEVRMKVIGSSGEVRRDSWEAELQDLGAPPPVDSRILRSSAKTHKIFMTFHGFAIVCF